MLLDHRPAPRHRLLSVTFSEFSKGEYRSHAKVELSPSWQRKQFYQLKPILAFLGEKKLDMITAGDIEAYAAERLAKPIKRSSVNNEIRTIARVLSFAREKGYQVPVVVKQIRDTGHRRVRAWSEDELGRLLRSVATHSPDILPLVVFLANTGMRKGEALAARWDWVDLSRRMITVHPSDSWKPKSGKPREVPISDALLPWLKRSGDAGLGEVDSPVDAIGDPGRRAIPDRLPGGPVGYLFPTPAGSRYSYWPQLQFDRARKAAALAGGPHTLRHTFASMFLAAGGELHDLAQILGHSSTRVTELYAHWMPEHLERARNRVQVKMPRTK